MVSRRQLIEWVSRAFIGSLISAASIHAVAAQAGELANLGHRL